MGFLTTDVTDERDALATFATQQIDQIATTLQGLDRIELTASPTVSALSLGSLTRHALLVATDYAAGIAAAPEFSQPTGGGAGDGGGAGGEAGEGEGGVGGTGAGGAGADHTDIDPEALRPDDTADSLIAELRAAAEALDAAIRSADPDTPFPAPDAPWLSGQEKWTVRWCAMHMTEEIARHAGHADILRESIDGKIAYELNALADGEEWPPTGW